ncbi:hypothetical protein BDN71DRAFT_179860 [Pleurotus eryngii]|uniref:Ataxin-10 homolog n=1 Tax=Pleurotus eryngii TaxID=5323 RepID=A0A9P6A3V2_PLEER|nr:hypothetical protein BDN71DRAFT_179860 [Pleurotus eryngii]
MHAELSLTNGSDTNSDSSRLCDTCRQFDVNIKDHIVTLTRTLDVISKELARSRERRCSLGSNQPSIWPSLRKLWRDLARAQLTFWDGDEDEGEDEQGNEKRKQQDLRVLCTSLAKFTRNLVADVPSNQNMAFENEVEIRRLLHYHSSWTANQDSESFPVTRVLTQTLSNIVTANNELLKKLWNIYLNLPEDQVVLIRLLASPDEGTVLAVMVLILNCVYENKARAKMLCKTSIGCRICVSLLDGMSRLYEAHEDSDGARAFDVGYDIFLQLTTAGLVPELYSRLLFDDEIAAPHQTTLLKLVDSYLQSVAAAAATVSTPAMRKIDRKLCPMLSKGFFTKAVYTQHAIKRFLGEEVQRDGSNPSTIAQSPSENTGEAPPIELDVMLPKVCEALVLITQCISTITLESEERELSPIEEQEKAASSSNLRSARSFATFREYFNETRYADNGLVETLIETLRLLDKFLPRINFGRPVSGNESSPSPTAAANAASSGTHQAQGFSYLKRDLVRLLGILCHSTRSVQDRVRKCGGIEVVMNLCVIDERNPYLREHAIFTLHNILENNPENQKLVDGIKPMGTWGEDGVLQDVPSAVRR